MKSVSICFNQPTLANFNFHILDDGALLLQEHFYTFERSILRVQDYSGAVHYIKSDVIASISFNNVEDVENGN